MKVPDKICVSPHQIFDYDLNIQDVGHNGAEEYFRKDFIKAEIEKKIKELPEDWNGSDAAKWAYIDILNLIDIKSALK